jgi:hypothetical protein
MISRRPRLKSDSNPINIAHRLTRPFEQRRSPRRLTRELAARLLRRDLGGAWRWSRTGRAAAARDHLSVVVKLGSPAAALRRLAELEVTPPVLAWGEHEGSPYTVQVLAAGTQPDAAWFAAHAPRPNLVACNCP